MPRESGDVPAIARWLGSVGRRVTSPASSLRVVTLRAAVPSLLARSNLLQLIQTLTVTSDARVRPGDRERVAANTERLLRPLRFWPTTCLYRALARYSLHRAVGDQVRFVMGVKKAGQDGQDIVGHAWLERDGQTVNEDPWAVSGYKVVFAYPSEVFSSRPHKKEAIVARIKANSDALLTELNDGTGVLLHLGTKFFYTLNRTGVFVWKILADNGASGEAALTEAVQQAFNGVDPESAQRDIVAMLQDLADEGLVDWDRS